MTLREQQLKYEEDTDSQAAAERLDILRKTSLEGDANLPRAQKFISRAYLTVKQSIEDACAVKTRGVGGKFKGWLRKVPPNVAAVLALRECINGLTAARNNNKPVTIQQLASSIGRLYELEVRIADAELVNPLYMKKIHEQVRDRNTTSQHHLRKLYDTAWSQVMKDELDNVLSNSDILQLGKFGVQACMDAGIVTCAHHRGSKGVVVAYELTAEVFDFLSDYNADDVSQVLDKSTGAMLCPPDPWTNLRDGGYISPRRKFSQPLMSLRGVRKSERSRIRAEFTEEKMPQVFEAANYLQSIAFKIHGPTLNAIKETYTMGGGVLGVPTKNPPAKPVFPLAEDWIKDGAPDHELAAFTQWKRATTLWYDALREWRGKVREVAGFIKVASRTDGSIWFPVFFDTRGRWYYRGSPNPQGSDLSKAALHFGDSKPLGKRGLYWLRVHIANCAGFDKERFDVRAQWTTDNWDSIVRALDKPQDFPEVWGTDAPWCMFSAAWELRAALATASPETYESGIVVHMDATCSGLQHFSAILRDPVGGGMVNLYDDMQIGPKQDIYSKVSTNALAAIKLDTEDSDPVKSEIALWWLKTGIERGMAKTPVMTYVYGATLRGTVDFVQQYVEEELGLKFPTDSARPYDYAQFAARKLFSGIASTVPAAEAAMQWLKSVARQMPKGKRMEWHSPTGFLVQHDYQDFDEVRVKLRSCGVVDTIVREYNEDTRAVAMQNAIAPNFVHALDASHLTLCAIYLKSVGVQMAGIHDSFGTHSCDVDTLHSGVRDSFVDLYQARNVLSEFLWEVDGVGEVPMRGTLDLQRVRDSEFFFC